jgi:hypothetical protein
MHGVMPPHPGPVIASKELAVDMGRVLFWGFIIGIPTAAVAGPIYARFIVKRVHTEAPAVPDKSRSLEPKLTAIPFLDEVNGGLIRAMSGAVLLHRGPQTMLVKPVDVHFSLFLRTARNDCFALFMDIEHEFSGFFKAVAK